jgi:glycosyltransferase involved in cell wall biosynthesis
MKIMHLLWTIKTGGTENLVVDLANFQSKFHEVIVIVVNDCVDVAVCSRLYKNVKVIYIERPEGSRNPYWIFKTIFAVRRCSPDVVHVHDSSFTKLMPLLPGSSILTIHAMGVFLPDSASKFNAICCISKAVLHDVQQRYPSLDFTEIRNGIDTSSILVLNRPRNPTIRILQVSRLQHQLKGQDLLILALARVRNEGLPRPVELDFIGDGPSLDYLRNLAKRENIYEICHFAGLRSRQYIYENLYKYDILVQPSRLEGFGLTIIEGMAAKVPVLVSNIDAPMQVIDGGRYGFFFQADNVNSLASVLMQVISKLDADELNNIINSAKEYVRNEFDISISASMYIDIYKKIA